ncbi:e6ea276d-6f44-4720-a780-5e8ff8940fe2 [Thermothielavioides terrestris]|jgi:hypothetical protein|uniref:E6ea276d-6f44-4720-a780-5e8ff8940fe2 n=1 Tax=Thermothielavioides terrestris TaxID=2587410 RepID=A0A3S4C257_9PEZI|nr:e6ea276d-6f44-4720-a780-5e8ff8940fe2 [Thermothielavioides terrestris]
MYRPIAPSSSSPLLPPPRPPSDGEVAFLPPPPPLRARLHSLLASLGAGEGSRRWGAVITPAVVVMERGVGAVQQALAAAAAVAWWWAAAAAAALPKPKSKPS